MKNKELISKLEKMGVSKKTWDVGRVSLWRCSMCSENTFFYMAEDGHIKSLRELFGGMGLPIYTHTQSFDLVKKHYKNKHSFEWAVITKGTGRI